jgi:hypothetical protein
MKPINRKQVLRNIARGGVLTGLVGYGVVLVSREDKFECSTRCGAWPLCAIFLIRYFGGFHH